LAEEKRARKREYKKAEKLTALAKDLGMTLPVLAIAWCLKNNNVSTVILGASKTAQLKENFKASEAKNKLTPEVMLQIEKILNNTPVKPNF
jgi:aryl-alcohol dehydrogenase-like predicted oxidoreductase